MTDSLLMFGDTERCADLFHAIPLSIVDPFLYAENGDRKVAVIGALERDRILGLGRGIEVIDPATLGQDELFAAGYNRLAAEPELALRACRELQIAAAAVYPDFPVAIADHLRANEIELTIDAERFITRRRSKTAEQLAGIRRAQKAADAAMAAAARLIRELPEGLSCECVRTEMQQVCAGHGATLGDEVIVAHGAQSALGHESGFDQIASGEMVLVDIWPRDKKSRCYADMSRTFMAGGAPAPAELTEYWTLVRAAMEAVMPAIRAGVDACELFELACAPFAAAGQPTQLSKAPGEVLDRGFYHSLGHGVGLELHEPPGLGRSKEKLVAGDVITVEPGCYRPGFGGVRLEDLVLVTEQGCEVLTDFPYDL